MVGIGVEFRGHFGTAQAGASAGHANNHVLIIVDAAGEHLLSEAVQLLGFAGAELLGAKARR